MDHQPFRLARPMSSLLEGTLHKALSFPSERIGPRHADSIFTFAINDHVAHGPLLVLLADKLRAVYVSSVASPRHRSSSHSTSRRIRSARSAIRAPATISSSACATSAVTEGEWWPQQVPVLSLRAARPFLSAVQRFPASYKKEKDEIESLAVTALIDSQASTTTTAAARTDPSSSITSTEVSQLWGLATQLSAWADAERVGTAFSLVEALPLQSDAEFTDVLAAILTCTHESLCDANEPLTPHRDAFLFDKVGTSMAIRRCEDALRAVLEGSGERQRLALPSRVSNAVLLAAALRGASTGRNSYCSVPAPPFLSESRWKQMLPAPGPHSLSGLTLHGWFTRLAAVEHAGTPAYMREGCRYAMVEDLWAIYTSRGDSAGTLQFQSRGLPALIAQERLFEAADCTALTAAVQRYHADMLSRHLGLSCDGDSSRCGEMGGAALPPDALVNLLLSFSLVIPPVDGSSQPYPVAQLGSTVDEQRAHGILIALEKSVASATATLTGAASADRHALGNSPLHQLDATVRAWPLMDTVCLLVALDRLFRQPDGRPTGFALGKEGNAREAIRARLLRAVAATPLLNAELLERHGSARVVSTLLLDAPHAAGELGLTPMCMRLLAAHAQDGFSYGQLRHLTSDGGVVAREMSAEARAAALAAMAHVPPRGN